MKSHTGKSNSVCLKNRKTLNRPIRLTQCCTQFKSPGYKILCVLYLQYNVAFTLKMIWKFLKQNVLFPKGLNWVQH